MNPDTGKLHPLMAEDAEEQKKRLQKLTDKVLSAATDSLLKTPLLAEDVPEAELKKEDPVPPGWPQFEIGELIPIKGFHFKLERIEDHCLVLRCHGMTKAERRRRDQEEKDG